MMIKLTAALLILVSSPATTVGFVTTPTTTTLSRRVQLLLGRASSSSPYSSEGDRLKKNTQDNDSDSVRDQLEHLLRLTPNPHHDNKAQTTKNDQHPHILTSHAERIKEMELHLLDCLQDSDDAIDTLVSLWMGEHGEEAAAALNDMQYECSRGLVVEEQILRSMIAHFSDENWVEPMSRLAVLLFTRGQYDEATHWCYRVLDAKPWHFETTQLLIVTWLRRENYPMAVRTARQYALPNLNDKTQHKRRRAWVQQNRDRLQQELQASRVASQDIHHDEYFSDEECQDEQHCWA